MNFDFDLACFALAVAIGIAGFMAAYVAACVEKFKATFFYTLVTVASVAVAAGIGGAIW